MSRLSSQRGAVALMLLMGLFLVLAVAVFVPFSRHSMALRREVQTQNALNQAKQLLLSAALSKRMTDVYVRPGEFLCPDMEAPGENGYSESGQGTGVIPSCLTPARLIGRIPWKHYQSEPLLDGSGEPLWMAVADGFQERKGIALNSDTAPDGSTPWFYAAASAGTTNRPLSDAADPVVVVILAPGAPLAGQQRRNAAEQKNPANYFECNRATLGGGCLGAPDDFANYDLGLGRFLDGPRLDGNGNPVLNDRLITIRRSELMIPLERRAAREYQQLLELWAAHVGAGNLPRPARYNDADCTQTGTVNAVGCEPDAGVCRGRPAKSMALTGPVAGGNDLASHRPSSVTAATPAAAQLIWESQLAEYNWLYRNRWEQLFFYAVQNGSDCNATIQLVNMPAPSSTANAVLMAAGVAQSGQSRSTVSSKELLANYMDLVPAYTLAPDINRHGWDAVPPNIYARRSLLDSGNDRLYYRTGALWHDAIKEGS